MNPHDDLPVSDAAVLDLEPEQLDGHSIDELVEYLDHGRIPPDPAIEGSPVCRRAIAALVRLEQISQLIAAKDSAAQAPADETWIRGVLQRIDTDAHAGADIPIGDEDGVVLTEGALRGLIRATGDAVPGLLIGRVRFRGDLASCTAGAVTIDVDIDVVQGYAIPETVPALRTAILERVAVHTRVREPFVDVAVRDLLAPGAEEIR